MSGPVVITLDGPAGVGKSTLAKKLAGALSLPYLDTGAMFRTLALRLGNADPGAERLQNEIAGLQFGLAGTGEQTALLVNGRPVGPEIRGEEVGRLASRLAKRPEIRAALRDMQRDLGAASSLIAEGRDLGTVVFPGAAVKFFLEARPEIRAERRWRELQERGEPASLAGIAAAMAKRDEQDRTRAIAPLKPASDAILVDTSDLSVAEAVSLLARRSREILAPGL